MQLPNTTPDLERGEGPARNGYPSLAAWISHDPDNESYVFRSFKALGARNLVVMQNQLLDLEDEIERMDNEASKSDDMMLRGALRRWENFESNAKDMNRPEHSRMELEMKLRGKIKEYHEALLLQSQICALKRPQRRVLGAFRSFFMKPNLIVSGKARFLLDKPEDLLALHSLTADPLSAFLRSHWPFPGKYFGDSKSYHTRHYQDFHVQLLVGVINAIVAAILLLCAIVGLYQVKEPPVKLGMIGGFTVLFAATVAAFTRARRAEVFASSAAYAAVLVVFVSGNLKS